MAPDKESRLAIELMSKTGGVDASRLSIEDSRKAFRNLYFTLFAPKQPCTSLFSIENTSFNGPFGEVPLRVYKPSSKADLPICMYFHGGGWVRGDLDIYDHFCRMLSSLSDFIVISVDYHLSPEYKFPNAIEEAYSSIKWAAANAESLGGNALKLAVAGDSSGGNIAASSALLCRDRKEDSPRLCFQLLIYPVLNMDFSTRSYVENGEGYFLTRDKMIYFWNQYLSDKDKDSKNPYACPLISSNMQGLPPAHIVTAEFDPLRDEGQMYWKKLNESGVKSTYEMYQDTIHAFVLFSSVIQKGAIAISDVANILKSSAAKNTF
jgi:acetyl esterase